VADFGRGYYDAPRDDSRAETSFGGSRGWSGSSRRSRSGNGQVPLAETTAHVWIFQDREERTKLGDMFATGGHIAALYKGEMGGEIRAAKLESGNARL
jgi:hypothetical protein